MARFKLPLLSLTLRCALWQLVLVAGQSQPPNVLLVVIDDMPFLSSFQESLPIGTDLEGHTVVYPNYPTPNIDEFRSEAVIFAQTHCGGPKCAPSRYSILTGRQPTRCQFAINATLAREDGTNGPVVSSRNIKLGGLDGVYNIPSQLKMSGYYTGMVGKWHLMDASDNGHNYDCASLAYEPDAELYDKCRAILYDFGFDFVEAWYVENINNNEYFSHNPEWMVSQSQRFIDLAVNIRQKPFFLYFAATLTHSPDAAEALRDFTFLDTPKGLLRSTEAPDDTAMMDRHELIESVPDSGALMLSVAWMDDMFGALIQYLKDENLYDDTFVVFQNDHGQEAKGTMYQQGSRIMNFVRYPPAFGKHGPNIMPLDFVTSNVDLAATIFDLAGINPMTGYILDGVSYIDDVAAQILDGDTRTDEQTSCVFKYIDTLNSHSIVTGHYQYIWRATLDIEPGGGADLYPHSMDDEQLYDLIADPNQKINLVSSRADDATRDVIADFELKMMNYIDSICPALNGEECKKPQWRFETASPYLTMEPTRDTTTTSSTTTLTPTASPTTSSPTASASPTATPAPTFDFGDAQCLRSPSAVRHNAVRTEDLEWSQIHRFENTFEYVIDFEATSLSWDLRDRIDITTRLFNGFFPSQTLRFERGNTYLITLRNRLGPESLENPTEMNVQKDVNTTNMHMHGLHMSPSGDGDNVFVSVGPGESFTYEYKIPCNHAGGTFWWHPHHHGSAHLQVAGGAAGAMIIEDDAETEGLPSWYTDMEEMIFFVSHIHTGKLSQQMPSWENLWSANSRSGSDDEWWVNGEILPTVCQEAGEWTKFRFAHIETTEEARIYYFGNGECQHRLLAKDGVMVHGQNNQDMPREVGHGVFLAHSSRADVAISCPGDRSGSRTIEVWLWKLESVRESRQVIAYVQVFGTAMEPRYELSAFEPIRPDYLQNMMPDQYRGDLPLQTYDYWPEDFGEGMPETYDYWKGLEITGANIAGVKWGGETNYLQTIDVGKRHIWEVVAGGNNIHPLHVHTNHFQMINSTLDAVDVSDMDNWIEIPDGYQSEGDWLDTIWGPGYIVFQSDVYAGTVTLHCHILIHEDQGAMATILIQNGCDADWNDVGASGSCSSECKPTTLSPTADPTESPTTSAPTTEPTTASPTTSEPTTNPSAMPTTIAPSNSPVMAPTASPTTSSPTTVSPTATPTTTAPSLLPTTFDPTLNPTTVSPTAPSNDPTSSPTLEPTAPTMEPTTAFPTTSWPTLAHCETHDDCTDGSDCVDGFCEGPTLCADRTDCEKHEFCNEHGVCEEEIIQCYGSDECFAHQMCDTTLFICVELTEEPGCCAAHNNANSSDYASASDRCYEKTTRDHCERFAEDCFWRTGEDAVCVPEFDGPGCCFTNENASVSIGCCNEFVNEDRCLEITWNFGESLCDWRECTTTTTTTTIEPGCCAGDSRENNAVCNNRTGADECGRYGHEFGCHWVDGMDAECEWVDRPGCCIGEGCTTTNCYLSCGWMYESEGCWATRSIENNQCQWVDLPDDWSGNESVSLSRDIKAMWDLPSDWLDTLHCEALWTSPEPTLSPTAEPTAEPGCCYPNPSDPNSQFLLGVCPSMNSSSECLYLLGSEGDTRCLWMGGDGADCTEITEEPELGCCYPNPDDPDRDFLLGACPPMNNELECLYLFGSEGDTRCLWMGGDGADCTGITLLPSTEPAPLEPSPNPTPMPTDVPGCCYPNPDDPKQQFLIGVCPLMESQSECLSYKKNDNGTDHCLWTDIPHVLTTLDDFDAVLNFDCSSLWTETPTQSPSSPPTVDPGCCYPNPDDPEREWLLNVCPPMGDETECLRVTDNNGTSLCYWLPIGNSSALTALDLGDPMYCIDLWEPPSTTDVSPGCCKGDSAQSSEKCGMKENEHSCENINSKTNSTSCSWVEGGIAEVDCAWLPGCCLANYNVSHSTKWEEACAGFDAERECLSLENGDGDLRCEWESTDEFFNCSALWITTTEEPDLGCCYPNPDDPDRDFLLNACPPMNSELECLRLTGDDGYSRCYWEEIGQTSLTALDVGDPMYCISLWDPPSTTSSVSGCCRGDSAKSSEKCEMKENEQSCSHVTDKSNTTSCSWVEGGVAEVDCAWLPGCCWVNLNVSHSTKWEETCDGFDEEPECLSLENGDGDLRCEWERMDEFVNCSTMWITSTTEAPGCCAGNSSDSSARCNVKEDEQSCERTPSCQWIIGDDVDCSWIDEGCCHANVGVAYSARWDEQCKLFEDQQQCLMLLNEDASSDEYGYYRCCWTLLGDFEDCSQVWPTISPTSQPTTSAPGCCAGDNSKSTEMCAVKETANECSRSSSCHWIIGDDADCSWTATTTIEPGCCYVNPESAYSARWQSQCVTYFAERECLLLLDENNATRCHWEALVEQYDCSLLWPTTSTTTLTPTEPGCCAGDSLEASVTCGELGDEYTCDGRKACRWVYGEDADCAWTEPGCCFGNPDETYSVRWDEKCKEYDDAEWCLMWSDADGGHRCHWEELGNNTQCDELWITETTTESPEDLGCCYPNPDDPERELLLIVCPPMNSELECHSVTADDDGHSRCYWEEIGKTSLTALDAGDPTYCISLWEPPSTTTTPSTGCCAGDSLSASEKCIEVDADKCDSRDSCHWESGVDADCEWVDEGCCHANIGAEYSARWEAACKLLMSDDECVWEGPTNDDGDYRCCWTLLGEYEDCSMVWPTTTTASPGCCRGGGEYEPQDVCWVLMDAVDCDTRGCEWIVTDDMADCLIAPPTTSTTAPPSTTTTSVLTTSTPSTALPSTTTTTKTILTSSMVSMAAGLEAGLVEISVSGCCRSADGTDGGNDDCLALVDRVDCEQETECAWLVTEDVNDCALAATSGLGSNSHRHQKSSSRSKRDRRSAKSQSLLVDVGNESVVTKAMDLKISLTSALLVLFAAFAVHQMYNWCTNGNGKESEDRQTPSTGEQQPYYQCV